MSIKAATRCTVRMVTNNQVTVEVTGAVTVPRIHITIPCEDTPFTRILEVVRQNIQGRLTEPVGVVEMICSMAFALRFSRNSPTKTQAQATPLTTLVFSWGGEIKPNVTMTLANTTDTKFSFNVHYMIGSDNITVPIVLNCVREERELCVDTVLRELERNISSSPRPYQLAMMSMLYCLWCLRVVHCSKVQEFTVFNISLEQQ